MNVLKEKLFCSLYYTIQIYIYVYVYVLVGNPNQILYICINFIAYWNIYLMILINAILYKQLVFKSSVKHLMDPKILFNRF